MLKKISKLRYDENGQTSVELILLIGSILIITIICGTYIYKINYEIAKEFNQTINNGREHLINKI